MARKITIGGSFGIRSYKTDGTTIFKTKSVSDLNGIDSDNFPSNSAMKLVGIKLDASVTTLEIRNTALVKLAGLETPSVTDGTAITLISNASITSGYEDGFSSVQTGTTYLPPSSSENRTWAFKYTLAFEGTCRIRGNGAPTGSMTSGNDRAIYILKNGTQIAAAGSSVSSSNWAEATNQSVSVGDLIQYDIRDVYWRYSNSGVQAQNCQIRVATYS